MAIKNLSPDYRHKVLASAPCSLPLRPQILDQLQTINPRLRIHDQTIHHIPIQRGRIGRGQLLRDPRLRVVVPHVFCIFPSGPVLGRPRDRPFTVCKSVDDGADAPDVVFFRHQRDLGANPFIRSAPIGLCFQGREAEIAKHDFRDGVPACELVPKKHVCGLDVAMDDPLPAWRRRSAWILCEAVGAIVEERERVCKLDEALPYEILGDTARASSGGILTQIAPLAVFEVQDKGAVGSDVIRVVELDDPRVGGQYVFKDVHLAGYVSVHGEAFLFLAHQDLPVAFPLDDPQLPLAALADLSELLVAVFDDDGAVLLRGSAHSSLPYRATVSEAGS